MKTRKNTNRFNKKSNSIKKIYKKTKNNLKKIKKKTNKKGKNKVGGQIYTYPNFRMTINLEDDWKQLTQEILNIPGSSDSSLGSASVDVSIKDYLQGLENLFKTKEIEEESKDSSIQKSICSLMIEVAYADNQLDESELIAMANSLSKLDIEKEEIQEIVDATLAKSKESISFYEHTRILNDQLDYDQKKEVLNSVWAIAFADGEMDKHEEHLIRRIADLLYLNHKDFINAKLNQKETNEDS